MYFMKKIPDTNAEFQVFQKALQQITDIPV